MKRFLLASMLGTVALGAWSHTNAGGYALDSQGAFHYSDVFDVAIADMDRDGRDDLVVATSSWSDALFDMVFVIEVHFQEPDGTLRDPVQVQSAITGMASIAVADVHGDDLPEIVVSDNYGLYVLTADGSGGFDKGPIASQRNCAALLEVDADEDGTPDFVCFGQTALQVLYGDGAGGTREAGTLHAYDDDFLQDMTLGDVTGDGRPDLLVLSGSTVPLKIFAGNGEGFDAPTTIPAGQDAWGSGIGTGDFDGNGFRDIAIVRGGNSPDSFVRMHYQHEGTGFADAVTLPTLDLASAIEVADLDGNGTDDLLVGRRAFGQVSHYLQWTAGLGNEHLTPAPSYTNNSKQMTLGDLNSDGCPDLVTGAYSLEVYHGACHRAAADFDDDGHSDLLWRNPVTGGSALWGGAMHWDRLPFRGVANLGWQVVGVGDIDGDGLADAIWREANDGQNVAWLGGDIKSPRNIARVTDPDWRIAGVGDLDGDGLDDLVWRHAATGANTAWLAADATRSVALRAVSNTDWLIAAVADFDGDDADDLLWRNPVTGANTIWLSGDADDQDNITDVRDTTWTIVGVGDFDADGRADILWRNTGNGRNVVWRGGQYADQAPVRRVGDTDWRVSAIADYDGDGRDDIFWRHATTGRNVYWSAADATVQVRVRGVTNLDWTVVP